MPTFSKNTRRSASSVGLVSNITYPAPDGVISDSNSDGSDLRHIAGIYRGENIINQQGGSTLVVSASFGLQLNNQFINNLSKQISISVGADLFSTFAQTLTKTTTAQAAADLSFSFNNTSTKTVPTNLSLNLSSNFSGLSTTVVTAPQISFSIEEGLKLNPSLLTLLSSPQISLSVNSNIQLYSNITKTTSIPLSADFSGQFTSNSTKTGSASLPLDQAAQFGFALTKTLAGLALSTDFDTDLILTRIKSGSVVLTSELSSQLNSFTLAKTASASLSADIGVFIGGWTKSSVASASFGADFSTQFTAVAPSILDSSPSTFCFTMYIMKELDLTTYINQEQDFTMQFKNRC